MLLNADLGESFGAWTMGMDQALMPMLDQANIACGYHAGDPLTMLNTLKLAKQHGVSIGAHPSYPDLQGFGRRSIKLEGEELESMLLYQMSALDGLARTEGLNLDYVKPHGALYNDMMRDLELFSTIAGTIARFSHPVHLMIQATAEFERYQQIANQFEVTLLFEAFADRAYQDDGRLVPRTQPHAVHPEHKALSQAEQIIRYRKITTQSGAEIELPIDTLCVHGDNPEALALVSKIRELLVTTQIANDSQNSNTDVTNNDHPVGTIRKAGGDLS